MSISLSKNTDDEVVDLMAAFPRGAQDATYEGYLKVKLGHARGFSLLLPDLLAIDLDGWRYFQPQFFSPCQLSFFGDTGYVQLCIEPEPGVKLLLATTRDRLVRSYPDGSFLYRCRVAGPARLKAHATG